MGLTHTVEYAAEHILRNRKLQRMAEESHLSLCKVYAPARRVEQLNDGLIALDLGGPFAAAARSRR